MTDPLSTELARDASLLDRIAGGDETAQGSLYDVHATAVYSLAYRLTSDPEEAEEIVAAVFRLVWQQTEDARSSGLTLRAWLVALCRQTAAERPRHPRLVGGAGSGRASSGAARDNREVVLPLPAPEDIMRREHVQAALRELPEGASSALDLVFFDGLSLYDAAQRMGVPSHSARALIASAMQTLRANLRPVAIP